MDKQRLKEIILEEYDKVLKEGFKKKKYRKSDYKKYNKLVKRGKAVLVQTDYGDEFAWEDGSSYGVFASEEDGREIELDHNDIDIVLYEGRYRLSPQRDLEIHSGGTIAQIFGKKAVVALDKKSMKELVKLIGRNMGLIEKLEKIMEGKSFRLSNGVKVEFIGKMQLKLTNHKGIQVILDVNELRMFLKGANKEMGATA